jgi:HlyD family secretion protein
MSQRFLSKWIPLFVGVLIWGVGWPVNGEPLNAVLSVRGQIEGGSELFALGTSATGTILQLLAKPGDHVQAGQALLRVDCRDLESEVAARQSDLTASDAIFARVTHGSRPEEIAIGEANVNLANARLHEAQKEFDRAQTLHEGVTITRVQIDQAERDARMAEAMLAEVRAKLVLLKVGSREEDITEARARRDAAKARLDEAAARLAYCTVAAPISGVILSTRVSPGQLVSSMAPAVLITMVDDSKRRARAFVTERDINRVCLGEQGQISVEGAPGDLTEGRVETITPEVTDNPYEPGSGRVRSVILSISNTQKRQLPIGQMVSVKLLGCGS